MRTFAKRTLESHCATFQIFNEIASHKVGIQRLLCVSLQLSAVGDKVLFIFSGCNSTINPFPLMPCRTARLKSLAALLGTLIASIYGKQPELHAGAFICASQTQTSERITHHRVLDVLFLSPPTYCTHLQSYQHLSAHNRTRLSCCPLSGLFASLSQRLKSRQHLAAASLQLDASSQTTGLTDSSVPAKNFPSASERLLLSAE